MPRHPHNLAAALTATLLLARCAPSPTTTFHTHEAAFRAYAADLLAGKIPLAPDNNGYTLPKSLTDAGVTYAHKHDSCVALTLASMPTDATPQYWYSPTGFTPLPPPIEAIRATPLTLTFHLTILTPDWAYLETSE